MSKCLATGAQSESEESEDDEVAPVSGPTTLSPDHAEINAIKEDIEAQVYQLFKHYIVHSG